MRILQIRFKNLNSLAGEWNIDLTHPAFAADGLFAITGPTGAGKTTILDAICLALYGRTPRLSKISKSGNEIMSRQKSECFAEVTFETQKGRYRCHWSQHRARKKPDGELQAPKHEIADADSGVIFESKIRGVADEIETATGMNFDRFTRSMLLAQGGFAAFLQAAADERAPILEQITGTEIYSEISIRVHECYALEHKKLDVLQAELAGMHFLSAEEEHQLGACLEQRTSQDRDLVIQINRQTSLITWIEGIIKLEEELKTLGLQQDDLQIKLTDFSPEQEKLNAATRALELTGEYTALTASRLKQKEDLSLLSACQKSRPLLEEAAALAEQTKKNAIIQFETRKNEQHEARPIIRRARDLDLKISEKDIAIEANKDSITLLSKAFAALKVKQNSTHTELGTKRATLENLQEQLNTSRVDEQLVEKLAGIKSRLDAVKNLHIQLTDKESEIRQAEGNFQQASQVWKEQSIKRDEEKLKQTTIQTTLDEQQLKLQKILENRTLVDWRNSQLQLTAQKDLLTNILEAAMSLSQSAQVINEISNRKATLATVKLSLITQIKEKTEKQGELEEKVKLLETQLVLLNKIQSFAEARHQLQDGKPCPLCGAGVHPFAQGNTPAPDTTRERLNVMKNELKVVTDALADLKVKEAESRKDFEKIASDEKEHTDKINRTTRLINTLCTKLSPESTLRVSDSMLADTIKALQASNTQTLTHVNSVLEAAETIEKELNILRDWLEKAREAATAAENEALSAAHQKDFSEKLLERLKKEKTEYGGQQNTSFTALQQELQLFGVTTLSIENLQVVYEALTARRNQWVTRLHQKVIFDRDIILLEADERHQTEQIHCSEKDLTKQKEALVQLLQVREKLACERQSIFADKKPDEEEMHLATALDFAEKEVNRSRDAWSKAHQALEQLELKMRGLENTIEKGSLELESCSEAFLVRLKASNFSDEEVYHAACLTEYERRRLTEKSRQLSDQKAALIARINEKTELLQTEQQKQLTAESLEVLKNNHTTMALNLRALQQEIGGISQKLKDNISLKKKQQERLQAIDAQKHESSRWELLHELIGSSDGKKYRNFAQGLTFEVMIGHANRQLQKMTDRYLLIRDHTEPLKLNVIDDYQAGEIRSTRNLSGGESFIVSLSLALGLSYMASKNVRVDSLFLDEGFGTLDEEALDTALETLAGLQQDGKLIGVISHVQTLKERISIQIQVSPMTGGRSQILGPGCETLNRISDIV